MSIYCDFLRKLDFLIRNWGYVRNFTLYILLTSADHIDYKIGLNFDQQFPNGIINFGSMCMMTKFRRIISFFFFFFVPMFTQFPMMTWTILHKNPPNPRFVFWKYWPKKGLFLSTSEGVGSEKKLSGTPLNKYIGDEDPYYNNKISIFLLVWQYKLLAKGLP